MIQKILKYKIIRKPFEIIAGKSTAFTVEHQLLNFSLFLIGLGYLLTILQNIFKELSSIITIADTLETVFIIALFYISRLKGKSENISFLLIISIFISFSIEWFPNGGLNGSTPFFYLVLLTYIIFLTEKKRHFFLILFFLFNITILFLFEYYYPELVIPYKKRSIFFEDLFIAYLTCVIALSFIVYISKQLYQQEKKNTIDIIEQYRKNSENLQNTFNEKSSLLSFREREIFKLIIEGKTNKEIASQLFIEERTVKNHITSIYKKIEVKKRAELFAQI